MQESYLKMPYQFSKKSKKIVGTPENAQRLAILSNLLIQSSWRGKYNEVQKWIEQGAHPSVKAKVIKNGAMMTPLIATILGKSLENKNSKDTFVDHFKAFQILIEKGADIDHAVWLAEEKRLHPPVSLAIQYGFTEFVKFLIQKGANLDFRYHGNINVLHLAAKENRIEIAKLLLEQKSVKSKVNMKEKFSGNTPLQLAILAENYEMARLFLEHGVNVNTRSPKNYITALHSACLMNCPQDIIESLVKNGAEVDATDFQGNTPMMNALVKKNIPAVKFLLENGANPNTPSKQCHSKFYPLHMILDQDKFMHQDKLHDFVIFKLLIKHGAKIELRCNQYGDLTPLQIAARRGKAAETQYLIDMGADINVLDKLGRSAVHIAIQEGSKRSADTVRILIKAGANVNTFFGQIKWTPLHSAVMFNDLTMVKLLVEGKAEVNAKDSNGRTPLRFTYDASEIEVPDQGEGCCCHHGDEYDSDDYTEDSDEYDDDFSDENDSIEEIQANQYPTRVPIRPQPSAKKYRTFIDHFSTNYGIERENLNENGEPKDCCLPGEEDKCEDHFDYEYEKKIQLQIREYLLNNGATQTEGVGVPTLSQTKLGLIYVR